jgi:Zn-finger nucleic acid-binding protein
MKAQTGAQGEESARALAKERCPRCGEHLVVTSRLDVSIDACPRNHGIWLDDCELEKLMSRESSGWLARVLGRPR